MATAPDARNFPTVAFLGDSISTGFRGLTHPRSRWTSRVCDELGWRETNLSINGMGFFRRRGQRPTVEDTWANTAEDTLLLDALLRAYPATLVISLGGNDAFLLAEHADEVRAAIFRDLSRVHEQQPDLPVVVAPFNGPARVSERFAPVIGWIREACDASGHVFTDALMTAINDDLSLVCDDCIHPNDDGHARLAASILPVLHDLPLREPR